MRMAQITQPDMFRKFLLLHLLHLLLYRHSPFFPMPPLFLLTMDDGTGLHLLGGKWLKDWGNEALSSRSGIGDSLPGGASEVS